ncbi:hypothetical protein Mapa_012850 [Marchantia paleacea]|nr:hypothetical protein Mapa_012850 [Marchantia paleacea]
MPGVHTEVPRSLAVIYGAVFPHRRKESQSPELLEVGLSETTRAGWVGSGRRGRHDVVVETGVEQLGRAGQSRILVGWRFRVPTNERRRNGQKDEWHHRTCTRLFNCILVQSSA